MSDPRVPIVFSIGYAAGHVFMGWESTEDPFVTLVTCLMCGAQYQQIVVEGDRTPPVDPDDPWWVSARYETWNGDEPVPCSRDTSHVHGDAPCEADNGRECETARETGTCSHTEHTCNCLMCTG